MRYFFFILLYPAQSLFRIPSVHRQKIVIEEVILEAYISSLYFNKLILTFYHFGLSEASLQSILSVIHIRMTSTKMIIM